MCVLLFDVFKHLLLRKIDVHKACRKSNDIVRFLLDCWNDVRFHVLSFCTAKMFHDNFASTA